MDKDRKEEFEPKDLAASTTRRPAYPVAGFWIRAAAFVMDIILLNFFAYLLIFAFKEQLFQIGYYCGFLGAAINLAYFIFFNGPYGKGKTPGKFFLNLTTLQWSGEPLSLSQSAIRTVIQLNFLLVLHFFIPVFLRDVETIEQLFTIQILRNIVFAFFVANAILVATHPFKCGLHDLAVRSYVARDPKRLDIPALLAEQHDRLTRWQRSAYQSASIAFIVVFVIFIYNVSRDLLSAETRRQFQIRNEIKALLYVEGFEFIGTQLMPPPGEKSPGEKPQATPLPTHQDSELTTETAGEPIRGYAEFIYIRYGRVDPALMQRNREVDRALRRARRWVEEDLAQLLKEIGRPFEPTGVRLSFREVINLNPYHFLYNKLGYEVSETIE